MSQRYLTGFPAASNHHIFPTILYPNEVINRCEKSSRICDLTIFYIFPSNIQCIYQLDAKKIELNFSHVRVCGLGQTNFPPVICVYIISRRFGVAQDKHGRLELAMGISCLGWMQIRFKSAQMARHGYDVICANNLFGLCHLLKLST